MLSVQQDDRLPTRALFNSGKIPSVEIICENIYFLWFSETGWFWHSLHLNLIFIIPALATTKSTGLERDGAEEKEKKL